MSLAATFIDADTLMVAGDYTADFIINRRVRAYCGVTDGYKYTAVLSATYIAPNTTVNMAADSDDLTSNLTAADWGMVTSGTVGSLPLHSHADEDAGGDLTVDVINEATVASGVTIDSLLIRDGLFQTGGGLNFINETTNAKMTIGLTINQAANDDEILALKSSDVDQGFTDYTELDTYGTLSKISANDGGLKIAGYVDTGTTALFLAGRGPTDITTKSAAAYGYIHLVAQKLNGAAAGAVGADGNLMTIANNTNTRFIFDAEGSAHADVEWIAFQDEDDMALLDALEAEFAERQKPDGVLGENAKLLQERGLVNFYDDGSRAMVNTTRLNMLLVGTHRQTDERIKGQDNRLAAMEHRLAALEHRP